MLGHEGNQLSEVRERLGRKRKSVVRSQKSVEKTEIRNQF